MTKPIPSRTLISAAQIRTRVGRLGRELARHYRGRPLLVLGIMNGALFFLADLLRAARLEQAEIAAIRLASYAGTRSTGRLRGLAAIDDLREVVRGRAVLVVDDILDTGRTLSALTTRLHRLGAAEVKICVLLEKDRVREIPLRADWTGFHIPDRFVVGYGLDYDGKYRGLKQIKVLWDPADAKR